jgi:hypothetical protein
MMGPVPEIWSGLAENDAGVKGPPISRREFAAAVSGQLTQVAKAPLPFGRSGKAHFESLWALVGQNGGKQDKRRFRALAVSTGLYYETLS